MYLIYFIFVFDIAMKTKIIIVIIIILITIIAIFKFEWWNYLSLISKPCGYINFARWATKTDCSCIGYKIDTSCKDSKGYSCPDAGETTACIGIITKRKCYNYQNHEGKREERDC